MEHLSLNLIYLLLILFFTQTLSSNNRRVFFGYKVETLKPFMASLLYDEGVDSFWIQLWQKFVEKSKYYRHFCGGLIYNEHYVVTAAHCIKKGDFHYVGVYGLNYHHMGAYHKVAKKIAHPNFVGERNGRVEFDYDIGLVKTETRIQHYGLIPPYNPRLGDIRQNPIFLYGWGKTEKGEFSEELQELHLSYAPQFIDCRQTEAGQEGRVLCFLTYTANTQSGGGDSGSPIVLEAVALDERDTVLSLLAVESGPIVKNDEKYYLQIGVNFTYFVPWINSTINS